MEKKFCRLKVDETLNDDTISIHLHATKMVEMRLNEGDIVLLKAMGNVETLCVVYSSNNIVSDQVRVNEAIKTILRICVGDIVILTIVTRNDTSHLIDAAGRGLLSIIQYLVQKPGIDVNENDPNGISPLFAASLEGSYDVMKFLVGKGSKKDDTISRLKWSPIHWVAVSGDVSAMQQLLDEDPNASVDTIANDGWTGPYQGQITAGQENVGGGRTPLHFASSNGQTEMVKFLLARGAVANYADRKGWTPLYRAAAKGHLDVVTCLVQHPGVDINLANHMGFYPLITAAAGGHFEVLKYLAENNGHLITPTKNGWNPICFAALNGFLDMMIYLQERGVNMDSSTPDGFVPMLYAAWGGHVNVLEYLVKLGFSPSVTGNDFKSTLHVASANGHLPAVKYLLSILPPIVIHKPDGDGNTCLHSAVGKGEWAGDLDVVKRLLEAGVAVDHTVQYWDNGLKWHCSALQLAAENGHLQIVEHLVLCGADKNLAKDVTGTSPLYRAASNGHQKIVEYLLNAGAVMDQTAVNGKTPLSIAAEKGREEVVTLLLTGKTPLSIAAECSQESSVTLLPDRRSKAINQPDQEGRTPLHAAASNGHISLIKLLIETGGADEYIKDKGGHTYLELLPSDKKLSFFAESENPSIDKLKKDDHLLWFLIIQMDPPLPSATSSSADQRLFELFDKLTTKTKDLVVAYPQLASAKDANGRIAVDVASKPMRKMIESVVFFCGQYDIQPGPPVHKSATAVVVFAEDFKVDDEYEAAAHEAAGGGESWLNLATFEKALTALSKKGFGKATELLLDDANDTSRLALATHFRQCDKNNDGMVTTDEFVEYCETMLGRSLKMAIKFMRNKDQFLREIDARKIEDKSLDVNFVVGISRIYYFRKTGNNPSGVNLKLPSEFKREEVEHCDEVILDPSTDAESSNSRGSDFSRFYAIVMEVADRNLKNIFDAERPSTNDTRKMAKSVGEAMGHLHSLQLMHGDLKMLNVVRMGSQLKLIDLDAIASFSSGSPSNLLTFAGAKFSSGILPPEMFACLDKKGVLQYIAYWKTYWSWFASSHGPLEQGNEAQRMSSVTMDKTSLTENQYELWKKMEPRRRGDKYYVVKTFATDKEGKAIHAFEINGSGIISIVAGQGIEATKGSERRQTLGQANRSEKVALPYALVPASAAIDAWAFGALLFYLISATPLISVSRDEDAADEVAYESVFEWGSNSKPLERLIEIKIKRVDPYAAKLLSCLLEPNPSLRLSIAGCINDTFFKEQSLGNVMMALDELTDITRRIDTKLDKVLVKLDRISEQIEDVLECQRRGFEAILQQAERFHKEDKDYFKAQDAKLNAQFELLKTIDGKIDGLSEQLAKGFLKVEATFDRMSATIAAELLVSGEKQTKMMTEFDAFHDTLSNMDAVSFDKESIKTMMEDSMSTLSKEMKQQLQDSMVQVMDKANGSDIDPSKKDKLDHLIEMVTSTKEQITGMKKDVQDLNALSMSLTQLPTGSTEKYIMPRTFILVPVDNEPEPVFTQATTRADSTPIALVPGEKKKSRFGLPDVGISKTIITAGTIAAGAVGRSVVGRLMEKGKEALNKACRGAYRLCWKRLRVQFICPVTMQPVPMVGPEGCIITLPTDFLIYSAKALKYGMIILKIAMATQGLGGVVPDLSGIIPINLGMDIKQFASEYTELHGEATAILDQLKPNTSTPEGQVLAAAEGAGKDKTLAEFASLPDKFKEQFTGIADGDGTTEILAIYKLIAEGRKQTLDSALQSSWQPKDVQGKAWGMELTKPRDGKPGQMIWASEEGAKRLSEEGITALNPKADVNRDTIKTGSTATELAMSAAAMAADALAKTVGINLVAIKQRCAEKYGISPDAVMSVVTSPVFTQIVFDVASGQKDKAARSSEGLVLDEMQISSGLSREQLSALRDLLLSGGNDWTSLEDLAAAALDKSGVFGAKALWAMAKQAKSLKITAIERRAETTCGLRPGDVEAIFVAAVDSPVFKSSVSKLIGGDHGAAADLTGDVLDEVVGTVADRTGLPPDTINAVINAILTGNLTVLEEVVKNAGKVIVAGHGPKALWALAKQAKSLKIAAIERRAEEHGLKPGEVETLFLAAASDPVFVAAMQALMNHQPGAMTVTLEGSAWDALVAVVADKTGLLPAKVKAVVTALLTTDLTALEALASVSVKPLVSPRGAGRVAGLRDEVTSGGASVLHEVLKEKEVLLQQKEESMQAALQQNERLLLQKDAAMQQKDEILKQNERLLQQKDELLKQKDETMQLLRSQLEEAKQREADLLRSTTAGAIGPRDSTGTGSNFFGFRK